MHKEPTYRLVRHPDGLTHIERDGRSIGYAFERSGGGFGCGLFGRDETPEKALSARALLAWVKRHNTMVRA